MHNGSTYRRQLDGAVQRALAAAGFDHHVVVAGGFDGCDAFTSFVLVRVTSLHSDLGRTHLLGGGRREDADGTCSNDCDTGLPSNLTLVTAVPSDACGLHETGVGDVEAGRQRHKDVVGCSEVLAHTAWTEHARCGGRFRRAHVVSALLALLTRAAPEETLHCYGGAVFEKPGKLVSRDLSAAVLEVLQVRGANSRRRDLYESSCTLGLVDIDDLNRGRRIANCLHLISSALCGRFCSYRAALGTALGTASVREVAVALSEVAAAGGDPHVELADPVGDDGDRSGGVLHLPSDHHRRRRLRQLAMPLPKPL